MYELDPILLVVLALLVVVQIGLEVWAIVDIVRRPKEQIVGENKVLWIALVVFVNLIGAIVYLVVGRKPAPVTDVPAAPVSGTAAQNAIDSLYGPGGDER